MKYVKLFENFLFESNPYQNVLARLGSDLQRSADTVQDYLSSGGNKEFFLQGDLDGNLKDDKVRISSSSPKAQQLKPSQSTVYPDQSIGMLITAPDLRDQILSGSVSAPTLFVSADSFIIDGHHRWSATHALNPKASLNVTQINLPIKVAIPVLNGILRATDTPNQGKTGRPGSNVFQGLTADGVDAIVRDVIQNGVTAGGNTWMPPKEHYHPEGDPTAWYKWIAQRLKAAQSWKEVPYIIAANVNKMKKPAKFFGARDQMPQFPDNPAGVKSMLATGKVDVRPPLRQTAAHKEKKPHTMGQGPKN